jgi:hypothetical protein
MRGLRLRGAWWAGAAVLLGGLTAAAWGQAYTPVTIVVTGPDGAAVAGAEVRVAPGSPSGDHFVADEQGRVQVGMAPGEYQVQVTAEGYGGAEQKVVVADKALTLTMALRAAPANGNAQDVSGPMPTQPGAVPLDMGGGGSAETAQTLTITAGPRERGVFTVASLKDYPHQTVTVMDGKTKQPRKYSGVPLMDLLSHLGESGNLMGPALAKYVVATGSDGFAAVLSLAEVDPKLHGGTVLIADSMDGKPLDAKAGPFRLVVSEDKMPVRSVRNLVSIEVRAAE